MYILPQGFYDCPPGYLFNKISLEERLLKLFTSYGYARTETSSFEPYDGYRELIEQEESQKLIKAIDKSGDIIVLKNDMTVSLSRMVSTKLYARDFPLRLCYLSKVFGDGGVVERERNCLGVELFGESGVEGDAEMLALAVDSVKKLGINDFRIEIGHAGILSGVLNGAKIPVELQKRLSFDVNLRGLMASDNIDERTLSMLDTIAAMYGDVKVLEEASNLLIDNKESLDALVSLYQTNQILEEYGLDGYVCFNLGLSNNHSYYTGMIFRIIIKNNEEELICGGRHDSLTAKFGRNIPAVGFSLNSEIAVRILEKAGIPKLLPATGIVIGVEDRISSLGVARKTAENLINQGFSVALKYKTSPADIAEYAKRNGISVAFFINRLGKVEEVGL